MAPPRRHAEPAQSHDRVVLLRDEIGYSTGSKDSGAGGRRQGRPRILSYLQGYVDVKQRGLLLCAGLAVALLVVLALAAEHNTNEEHRAEQTRLRAAEAPSQGMLACRDWDVRLAGGGATLKCSPGNAAGPGECVQGTTWGTPLVLKDGSYHPICGREFAGAKHGADVFCRQLGYRSGVVRKPAAEGPGEYARGALLVEACADGGGPTLAESACAPGSPRSKNGVLGQRACRAGLEGVAVEVECSDPEPGRVHPARQNNPHCNDTLPDEAYTGTRADFSRHSGAASDSSSSSASRSDVVQRPKRVASADVQRVLSARARQGFEQFHFGRCALIGASSLMRGTGAGVHIDTYDTVIRVNHFSSPSSAADFGQKTDLLFLSNATALDNDSVTLVRGGTEKDMSVSCGQDLVDCRQAAIVVRGDWSCNVSRLVEVWGLDHSLVGCPHRNISDVAWGMKMFHGPGQRFEPSTGFQALLTFLPLCRNLDLFGFGGNETADGHTDFDIHSVELENQVEEMISDNAWGNISWYPKMPDEAKWMWVHAAKVRRIDGRHAWVEGNFAD